MIAKVLYSMFVEPLRIAAMMVTMLAFAAVMFIVSTVIVVVVPVTVTVIVCGTDGLMLHGIALYAFPMSLLCLGISGERAKQLTHLLFAFERVRYTSLRPGERFLKQQGDRR